MFFPNESYFNVYDGVLGAIAFDDEKPMAVWSHYHADALAARITEYRNRLRVAEWRVADNTARLNAHADGSAPVRSRLQQCVAIATAERDALTRRLSNLVERAHVMEAARVADSYAIKASPFDFTGE